MANPTYVFEGDQVYAMVNGRVVASSDNVEELEALEYSEDGAKEKEPKKKATHVVTPNGVKGRILSTVEDVFGEQEVSVRLENGRIAHLKVADAELVEEEEKDDASPIDNLRNKVDEDPGDDDKDSLKKRKQDLDEIKSEARALLSKGASVSDQERLDEIVVLADHEQHEIDERIEYLESEEAAGFEPPSFATEVVEQESLGRGDGGWLDRTVEEMIEEAENFDYDKLLSEGPESFVAELDEGALVDSDATQQIASSFIRSKTAAADPEVRDRYEAAWLRRVEEVRRSFVEQQKNDTKKEAAQKQKQDWENAPDESLFD